MPTRSGGAPPGWWVLRSSGTTGWARGRSRGAPATALHSVCDPHAPVLSKASPEASAAGSRTQQPPHSVRRVHEPPGREDGRSLDHLFAGVGETQRHEEGEFAHAGGAVARDDVGVAPGHDAVAETVPKLPGVDE